MSKLVVADTGPIQYLTLSGAIDALPELFDAVIIPEAVFTELTNENTPPSVRAWINAAPDWLKIEKIDPFSWRLPLGNGEREAIALALKLQGSLLLIDDSSGRKAATESGIKTVGTVGVIGIAAERGLIDVRITVERLRATKIYLSPRLIEDLLRGKP